MDVLLARPGPFAARQIRPLLDPAWDDFVSKSRNSSIFHTRPWLEAIHRTYGYQPVVFTSSSGPALENCLLFCRVDSQLTGSRLVSVPFSDHCAPLVKDSTQMQHILSEVERTVRAEEMEYLELRAPDALQIETSLVRSDYSYCFHQLDLSPDLDTLFHRLHKDSVQRKIRRAEREGLVYDEGRSDSLLDAFYRLLLMTRRRHRVPPQPRRWFRNLTDCMGDRLKIRLATAGGTPAAAVMTLRHKDTLTYKYGASDERFHNVGAMHMLLWRCIQDAKQNDMRTFDLGRSDCNNLGLVTFKERWGSVRSTLTYSRFGIRGRFAYRTEDALEERFARYLISRLPDTLFETLGTWLYPHIG